MPIYVRAGAIIPVDPVRQYTAEPVTEPTTLRVYRGADGDFTLYDDDGISQAYLSGDAAFTRVRWNDRTRTLTIEPDARYRSSRERLARDFDVVLMPGGPSRRVHFTGQRVQLRFLIAAGSTRFPSSELSTEIHDERRMDRAQARHGLLCQHRRLTGDDVQRRAARLCGRHAGVASARMPELFMNETSRRSIVNGAPRSSRARTPAKYRLGDAGGPGPMTPRMCATSPVSACSTEY